MTMPDRAALLARMKAAIEAAFDENLKQASIAPWFKEAGGMSSADELMAGYDAALEELVDLRDRQLAEVERIYGRPA